MAVVRPILLALATWTAAGDDFVSNMRKAESRAEPAERIEYLSRAIRAWTPGQSRGLLAHCHLRRGEARYLSHELESAAFDADRAISLDPRNARAHLLRGRLGLAARRPRDAVRDLSQSHALQPNAEAALDLGAAHETLRAHDRALAAYRDAARLDAGDHRALLGMARALLSLQRPDEAAAALREAERLAPDPSAEVALAKALALPESPRAEEQLGRAIELYEEELREMRRRLAPPMDVARSDASLGLAYRGRGRRREARGLAAEARADYQAACDLGSEPACADAARLAPPAPEPPRPKKRKKRYLKRPDGPGERLYAP